MVIIGLEKPTEDGTCLRIARERDLLARSLADLLVAIGLVRADATLSGPELLLASSTAADASRGDAIRSANPGDDA